jgi:hypothetical protein
VVLNGRCEQQGKKVCGGDSVHAQREVFFGSEVRHKKATPKEWFVYCHQHSTKRKAFYCLWEALPGA